MTLYDFHLLDRTEQIDLLYDDAVYIGKRRSKTGSIVLYQLEGFYIEVHYKKYRCHIIHLHCFRSTVRLEPYLNEIDVAPLVHL